MESNMREYVVGLVNVNDFWQSKLAQYHKQFATLQLTYNQQLLGIKKVIISNNLL